MKTNSQGNRNTSLSWKNQSEFIPQRDSHYEPREKHEGNEKRKTIKSGQYDASI